MANSSKKQRGKTNYNNSWLGRFRYNKCPSGLFSFDLTSLLSTKTPHEKSKLVKLPKPFYVWAEFICRIFAETYRFFVLKQIHPLAPEKDGVGPDY